MLRSPAVRTSSCAGCPAAVIDWPCATAPPDSSAAVTAINVIMAVIVIIAVIDVMAVIAVMATCRTKRIGDLPSVETDCVNGYARLLLDQWARREDNDRRSSTRPASALTRVTAVYTVAASASLNASNTPAASVKLFMAPIVVRYAVATRKHGPLCTVSFVVNVLVGCMRYSTAAPDPCNDCCTVATVTDLSPAPGVVGW